MKDLTSCKKLNCHDIPFGQELRVIPGFVVAHARLIDEFYAAHEFDVHVAFVAGQEQAHRIAVARHDAFAVLIERDHGVVQRFL